MEFHHPDRLGTKLITNNTANTSFEQSTLPFGTSLDAETTGTTNQRFTSYDRSTVAQLDYAVNRSYSSGTGRFTSVDPIGMGATNLGDPQSLNMYAYSGNEPINFTDPSGLNESMCSAEYSYGQCGGDSGFWGNSGYGAGGGGGGGFGDSVAYRNQTLGDLPPELQNSVDQHLERISNSQAGYGFRTNSEVSESRSFDILYDLNDDGSVKWTHFIIGVDSYVTGLDRFNDNLRNVTRAIQDATNPLIGIILDGIFDAAGMPGLKPDTESNAYQRTDTAITIIGAITPTPAGKVKATGWVARKIFRSLESSIQNKVKSAIVKGIVAPKGNNGIIKLTATEAAATGYTHKIKILGKGGDIRIYGRQGSNGHIIFDMITGH